MRCLLFHFVFTFSLDKIYTIRYIEEKKKKKNIVDKIVRWQSRFPVATTNAKSQKYETQIEYESEA